MATLISGRIGQRDFEVLEHGANSFSMFQDAHAIWKSWSSTVELKSWRPFLYDNLPSDYWASLSVVDVLDDGSDFSYRYWGGVLTQTYGIEWTNNKLSNIENDQFVWSTASQLSLVLETSEPALIEASFHDEAGQTVAQKINLRLPIFDRDGSVKQIATVFQFRFDGIGDIDEPLSSFLQ